MNLNELAQEVVESEGKKVNLSIAQIKEVIRIVLLILKEMTVTEVSDVLKRVKN